MYAELRAQHENWQLPLENQTCSLVRQSDGGLEGPALRSLVADGCHLLAGRGLRG